MRFNILYLGFFIGGTLAVPGVGEWLQSRFSLGNKDGSLADDFKLALAMVTGYFRSDDGDGFLPPVKVGNDCQKVRPNRDVCNSEQGWFIKGDSCYRFGPPMTLAQSRQFCAPGHLVAINSFDENDALLDMIRQATCSQGGHCEAVWSAQWDAHQAQWVDGNLVLAAYEPECTGFGPVAVAVSPNSELPCNVIYAGNDNPGATHCGEDILRPLCEIDLDGNGENFQKDFDSRW